MIRLKSRIVYKARQYPLTALLDVFFILLLLFVVHSSKFYVTGSVIGLDAGQRDAVATARERAGRIENEYQERPDMRPYVVADQMVLVILPKETVPSSAPVAASPTTDQKTAAAASTASAEAPAASAGGAQSVPENVANAASYRLELNSRPVTLAGLSDALIQAAERLRRNYNSVQRLGDDYDGPYRPRLVVIATPEIPVAVLSEVFGKIRQKNMDVVFKMAKY